jgi:hypothetical protein
MTDLTPNEIAGMVDALRRLADSSTWQSDTYIKCDELDKARKLANEAFMFFTAANALEKAPVWMARVQHLERELAEARKQARREARVTFTATLSPALCVAWRRRGSRWRPYRDPARAATSTLAITP